MRLTLVQRLHMRSFDDFRGHVVLILCALAGTTTLKTIVAGCPEPLVVGGSKVG